MNDLTEEQVRASFDQKQCLEHEMLSECGITEYIPMFSLNIRVLSFLRRYGRPYAPSTLPKGYRRRKMGYCFYNAYSLMLDSTLPDSKRPPLTYVEGLSVSENGTGGIHAWCVDADGRVIDPTWPNAQAYFGIPFQVQYVARASLERNSVYSVLNDYDRGYPLMKELSEQPHLWLAA
ncbi:MAG TPA: hypothetical protein VGN12_16870 [Pirellulales bacterium]